MQTLTFTLPTEMVQQIATLLAEHPYKITAPILSELQRQITAQQTPHKPVEVAENAT